MPNKQSLEITPSTSTPHLKAHTKNATYKYPNLKNEPYNMMAKPNYIVEIKGYIYNLLESPLGFEPLTCCNQKYTFPP
jgi:hypothetical protein